MPVNLDALLRYHTIDLCLQNRFKKWTWGDLANACADYALEVAPRTSRSTPSKRTIQNDIRLMRSADLGYFAPIKNIGGNYFYEDDSYSIKNVTLNKHDVEQISLAAKVLGQYKGFDFFTDLNEIFEKFESRLQVKLSDDLQSYIQFESVPELKGSNYLKTILSAITNKNVLDLYYQKFGDTEGKKHTIHPFLLKEYQSRWYVLAKHQEKQTMITFALDRILKIDLVTEIEYDNDFHFNHDAYFKDTIGITYMGNPAERIVINVDPAFAPYFITKPLHYSQQLVKRTDNWVTFEYLLVINQELENILMSHINHLQILEPITLKTSLMAKLEKAQHNFS